MSSPAPRRSASPWAVAARRFRANRPAVLGAWLLVALAAFSLLGPLLLPHDPTASDFSVEPGRMGLPPGPSSRHWLGTDPLFRDLAARLAHGGRLSLGIALAATALSMAIGTSVGLVSGMTAGSRFGFVDTLLMRAVDLLLAMPYLLVITAIGVAVGRADAGTILLTLASTGWAGSARVVRAKTLELRERDFVAASRALGERAHRIVLRHVLPNVLPAVLVLCGAAVGHMILAEATLGYLTAGVPPPAASWGRMLHEAEPYLAARPSLVLLPGLCILIAVLGATRVADGLDDALSPRTDAVPRRRVPADLVLIGAAVLLLLFASPGRVRPPIAADAPEAEARRGGSLRVATFVNVRTLDPAVAYDEPSNVLGELLFAKLVTWDMTGALAPDLAESWSVSPDGKRYVFSLRDGLRFADGTPLTARDLKRSLERTLHPKTPSPASSLYTSVLGAAEFHAGKAPEITGVRALADRTLEIELVEPDATFLSLMTLGFAAPVCASCGAFVDAKSPKQPCGAGPFRLERWDPETGGRLVRNELYHRAGLPRLDAIEYSVNVRPQAQRYKFEAGELDFVGELGAVDAALYQADPAWAGRYRWVVKKATNAIFMNTEIPPFDRRDVRRAVSLAVDPSVLARVRADVVPADRVVPPSIPGGSGSSPMRRHDLSAALEAMARAGLAFDPATGRGGWPEPVDYLTVPDSFEQSAAEIYQQQLARIGIRVRLRLVTFATYLAESSRRRTAQMGWAGWRADFPDASNFFEPLLASKSIDDEHSNNKAFFSSPELDAILEQARRERDARARADLYERAEEIVRDEAPWVPTYVPRGFEIWQPYVRGYEPHPILPQRFTEVWIARRDGPPLAFALPRPEGRR